jgi:predicted alpha/beta-hydrolase family hydrolase
MTEELKIEITDADSVSARLYRAARGHGQGVTLILAHGAGADQSSGFMCPYADGLSERGLDVLTFNFLYKEQHRNAPDPKTKLELCYRKVIEAVLKNSKLKKNRLLIGGKSMGGRIASQVAAALAEGSDPLATKIDGLVFLGYPLHPPGNPAKLRTEHLNSIPIPMLFVQGTRDSLGTPDEIRPFIKKLNAKIHVIEGGDHSFKAPQKFGLTQQQIHDGAMDEIVRWSKSSET